jgi:hypothetical protein
VAASPLLTPGPVLGCSRAWPCSGWWLRGSPRVAAHQTPRPKARSRSPVTRPGFLAAPSTPPVTPPLQHVTVFVVNRVVSLQRHQSVDHEPAAGRTLPHFTPTMRISRWLCAIWRTSGAKSGRRGQRDWRGMGGSPAAGWSLPRQWTWSWSRRLARRRQSSGRDHGTGRGPEGRPGHETCHPEDSGPWRPERSTEAVRRGRKVGNGAMGVAMCHLRNSFDRIGTLSTDPLLTNNLNILVEDAQLSHVFGGLSCGHGAHVANCPAWRF